MTEHAIVAAAGHRPPHTCTARRGIARAAAALALSSLLAACGLKAPLYLPQPVYPAAPRTPGQAAPQASQQPAPMPQRPTDSTSAASDLNRPTQDSPIP